MHPTLTARIRSFFQRFSSRFNQDRQFRVSVIVSSVAIVLVLAAGTAATIAMVAQYRKPIELASEATTTPIPSASATPQPAPQLVARALDGVPVASGSEQYHALAVVIENHQDARPQSGLGQASVVYEAIAEGGITRFLAVFADPAQAARVGPIRSARTYFVDIARELDAMMGHAGGNRDALDMLQAGAAPDLDGLILGAPLFTRDYSRGVAQEHTLYSSTDGLWNYATGTLGWSKTGDTSRLLYNTAPTAGTAAQSVVVSVSSPSFAVRWNYDPASNSYARTMAGTPHIDANTGSQITASTIILQTVDRRQTTTAIGEDGWQYTLKGSGSVVVIENGQAIKGTWKREGNNRTRYYDLNGKEIALTAGTMWVHLIHNDSVVSY